MGVEARREICPQGQENTSLQIQGRHLVLRSRNEQRPLPQMDLGEISKLQKTRMEKFKSSQREKLA